MSLMIIIMHWLLFSLFHSIVYRSYTSALSDHRSERQTNNYLKGIYHDDFVVLGQIFAKIVT